MKSLCKQRIEGRCKIGINAIITAKCVNTAENIDRMRKKRESNQTEFNKQSATANKKKTMRKISMVFEN